MSPADSPFAQLPAPGPHPATAELRAYAAGTLAPAQEHRIEAHILDCERCAELVDGFSMSDAATTDQAVADLRTRLQARVGTSEPVAAPAGWAWPRIAAAAALLGVVAGGIWGWEQHNTATSPTVARVETAPVAPAAPATPPRPDLAAASPETATTTAPRVAQASKAESKAAPNPSGSADYAAITPARRTRRVSPRAASRPTPAHAAPPDQAVAMADVESVAAAGAPVEEKESQAPAASPPAMSSTIGYSSSLNNALKDRSRGLVKGRTVPADTLALAEKAELAAPAKKAKSAATTIDDVGTAARVAVTPMPAAPAINPAPVGGTIALREYLRREAAEFSPEINALHLTGNVRVRFIVGADGKLSELKVTRGLRADYDSEALRIVCEGPAWQPGITGGKRAPLPMEVTVPVLGV